jgi:hypothetical protein
MAEREDRFFAAAAIAGGPIAADTSSLPGGGTLALGRIVTRNLGECLRVVSSHRVCRFTREAIDIPVSTAPPPRADGFIRTG